MKVAILSDIHGNLDALSAVLDDCSCANIEEYWILGDLIGYYYHSSEVIEKVRQLPAKIIAGNHEHYFLQSLNDPRVLEEYSKKYGSSLKMAMSVLKEDDIQFLKTLPFQMEFKISDTHFMICHGSPWNFDEYIYPDCSAEKLNRYKTLHSEVIFQGHTHYPMLLKTDDKLIINPGSLGQPRDRNPGAAWAIFDTNKKEISFKNTSYSIDSLLKEIDQNDHTNTYLKTVLTRR